MVTDLPITAPTICEHDTRYKVAQVTMEHELTICADCGTWLLRPVSGRSQTPTGLSAALTLSGEE